MLKGAIWKKKQKTRGKVKLFRPLIVNLLRQQQKKNTFELCMSPNVLS